MTGSVIKIGDFSKICQVSVKALRHWDKIGLLNPAVTDEQSGYRYYAIEQVETVNRIQAMKLMGLSLTQVSELLHDNPTPEEIRAMLRLKRSQLLEEIEHAESMLGAIESRLKSIEHRGAMPDYEVTLKPVPETNVLAIREVVPDMERLVDLLFETYPYANKGSGTKLMAVFHDEGYYREHIDVEVGFPAEQRQTMIELNRERRMTVRTLAPIDTMACTVHRGSWNTLSEGYVHLGRWINEQGYQITGAGREIFHHIDRAELSGEIKTETVTEIQFPVTRSSGGN